MQASKTYLAWGIGGVGAVILFSALPFALASGWAMSACFAICAFPQAYKCWEQGHGEGLSSSFLLLWLLGEIMGMVYSFNLYTPEGQRFWSWPLFTNYLFSTLLTLFIARYHFIPRLKWEKLLKTLKMI